MPQGEGVWGFCSAPHCFGGVNRHYQAERAKYSSVYIMETNAWIPTKFCTPVGLKTRKYASWTVGPETWNTKMADGRISGIWLTSGSGTPT